LLEGDHIIYGPSLSDPKLDFVQGCQDLDAEVRALHDLARNGVISMESAERQLNTYLLAAAHPRLLARLPLDRRRWLLLPISDAPYHGLIPDLGQVIHRVLARDPVHSAVSAVVEQCIPSMRHVCRTVQYTDSQDVLLNLMLALLLGLFPGNPKKPGFLARARLWSRMHALLTSTRERQTAFLAENQDILTLACMEYIARVVPAHMPAQDALLTGKDAISSAFFRRVPPACDEFRQQLDELSSDQAGTTSWRSMRELCAANVERVSRLKRAYPSQSFRDSAKAGCIGGDGSRPGADALPPYWDVPQLLLDNPSADEYRLLGLSLGMHGPTIMQIQRDIQITPLPPNLARLQYKRLLEFSKGEARIAHLRTRRCVIFPESGSNFPFPAQRDTECFPRRYMCMCCTLSHKTLQPPRLRLDTIRQTLVCAACMQSNLVQVELLGRVLRFRQQHFYLCPICVSIQHYKGQGEQPWKPQGTAASYPLPSEGEQALEAPPCTHLPARTTAAAMAKKKLVCYICTEPALVHTIDRIDHLTGRMMQFYYCQRHMPRAEVLINCVNARQLAAYSPVWRRQTGQNT
jgi:hypothetical protein